MKNIYLIIGNDKDKILRKTKEIINNSGVDQNSIIKYSMLDSDLAIILEDANTFNLFAPKKLIVVNDATIFSSNFDTDGLEKYLKNYNDSTYLIFTICIDKVDTRKKIYKLFNEKGEVYNLNDNKDIDFYSYALNYLKENGYTISALDIRYFLSLVGSNYQNITNELDKLMLLKIKTKEITKEDIKSIVNVNVEDNVFSFVDAITAKDNRKVIKLYHEFLNNNLEPVMLISLIASKFRLIYQVKRMLKDNISDEEMAKKTANHPYPVKLARNLSYSYTMNELETILLEFYNLDKNIKLGNINDELGLELLLLKIC